MMGRQVVLPVRSQGESESLALSVISLSRVRSFVRERVARFIAVAIGIVYAFGALLAGAMLQFVPTGTSGVSLQLLENSGSHEWWNFPALVVEAPGGVLVLPWLATVTMILISMGVGWGMSAGLLFAVRVVRAQRQEKSKAGIVSSLAGLSPALVAVATLGACCSTTAAAVGGLGALATATGFSVSALTVDTWYVNLLQMVVLGVALLAQEVLMVVFERLTNAASTVCPTPGRVCS